MEGIESTLEGTDTASIMSRLVKLTGGSASFPPASMDPVADIVPFQSNSIGQLPSTEEFAASLEEFHRATEPIDSSCAATKLMDQVFPRDVHEAQQDLPDSLMSKSVDPGKTYDTVKSQTAIHQPQSAEQFKKRIDELTAKLSLKKDSLSNKINASSFGSDVFSQATSVNQSVSKGTRRFEVESIRADFPALHQSVNGHTLTWFDNAATTQKPRSVIQSLSDFYSRDYSNIHRAAHSLAARATDAYEDARREVQMLIHAASPQDIVFVRGTSEGMNLVANTTKSFLKPRDEIVLTEFEHHANIVPWQMIAQETGARIRVAPFNDKGELIFDEYRRLLGPRTKIVSFTHASNTLGTILPIYEMTQLAKRHHAIVVIDAAQSIAHLPIDVQALECDILVFSGHKVFAPTGIGAVYIQPALQEQLPPWQGGGNMIVSVRFDDTTYADPPAKFEAGTPSIADAVGLGSAIRYLRQFNPADIESHEHGLLETAILGLRSIKGVHIYGDAVEKVALVSFTMDGYETVEVGKILDQYGIAVRTGHHCAQPSLRHFGLDATIRPSFAMYNTIAEVERLVEIVKRISKR